MKKISMGLAAMFAIAGAMGAMPQTASASYAVSGYPCTVGFFPPNGYYGKFGGITVNLYSEPFCQGTYLGEGQLVSTGATASCSGETIQPSKHPEAILAAAYQKLIDAAERGQRVQLTNTSCGQVQYAYFYGK